MLIFEKMNSKGQHTLWIMRAAQITAEPRIALKMALPHNKVKL